MERYIALLRGVNVGGKNKISMPRLKLAFEELGFLEVATYINSGNVIFSSDTQDKSQCIDKIEAAIAQNFGIRIAVTVLSATELSDALHHAPAWWNTDDKQLYHNAIFVISPTRAEEVFAEMGAPRQEYEQVAGYQTIIFWSASLKNFNKARWSKIAASAVNNQVTIRNANTTRKLLELAEK